MRVPVVAFGGGGPDEIIVHNETGLLIPPLDVERMASAAARLIADPALRQSMGQAARSRVEHIFNSQLNARSVERIYESLL